MSTKGKWEKKDWKKSKFEKQIRITKEDLDYLSKIKGKKKLATILNEIINEHKKLSTGSYCKNK